MKTLHTFHIPVMGTAFSVDTPIKVAKYGISSVISIVDDVLIEEMRKYYCGLQGEAYVPITKYEPDFRARRITAYLDLVDRIVRKDFEALKQSPFEPGSEITKYFDLLPEHSPIKQTYRAMILEINPDKKKMMQEDLRNEIVMGDINVNIMTKLDRVNFAPDGQELPSEFSDALAALRGYALSSLNSAIVFSAGINRRLYSYVEQFKDFYADATGFIKKRIILKVSDYRSSIIQGKFFAKKGLWVSEYRIESGLNCGGHAFATDGFLMGPILEEFKNKKQELVDSLLEVCNEALKARNLPSFTTTPIAKITAQGGIGTYNEDKFLREYYRVESTGWGSPFLLVPEVTNVDDETLKKLAQAKEEDLYLSDVSPLGVPFNNLRNSSSDVERDLRVFKGRAGSACPKGYLVSNTEFTPQPICTASRQYQKLKLEELEKKNLDPSEYKQKFDSIVVKSCICNDLGESVLINKKLGNVNPAKRFVAVCPGPNIAYFSKISTLKEMADHIYGRLNLLDNSYRPNMFIKELKLYVDYFTREVKKNLEVPTQKQIEYFNEFKKNMFEGIEYYRELFPKMVDESLEFQQKCLDDLEAFKLQLEVFVEEHRNFFSGSVLHPAAI